MCATMACISGLSNGSARPFMLRDMHEFTRSSIVISAPRRALCAGKQLDQPKDRQAEFLRHQRFKMTVAAGEIVAGKTFG